MRIFSSIMLGILLLGIGSYYPVFRLEQWSAKEKMEKEIRRGIDPTRLTNFYYRPTDLAKIKWKKKNREFEHNGTMYDVVTIDTVGLMVRLACISDKDESELVERYNKLLLEQNLEGHQPTQKTKRLVQLINALLYLPGGRIEIANPVALISTRPEAAADYQFEPVTDISRPPRA